MIIVRSVEEARTSITNNFSFFLSIRTYSLSRIPNNELKYKYDWLFLNIFLITYINEGWIEHLQICIYILTGYIYYCIRWYRIQFQAADNSNNRYISALAMTSIHTHTGVFTKQEFHIQFIYMEPNRFAGVRCVPYGQELIVHDQCWT